VLPGDSVTPTSSSSSVPPISMGSSQASVVSPSMRCRVHRQAVGSKRDVPSRRWRSRLVDLRPVEEFAHDRRLRGRRKERILSEIEFCGHAIAQKYSVT